MDALKCCFEASNALKKADDNILELGFDKIVSDLFGSKRNLIKFLLTPNHKLKKYQMVQIKDILNAELKRLMNKKDEESDDENTDIEKERIIPTLTNISEHVQVHITSFLDFKSIKDLSAVCMSIAPIALDQFSKIDIRICNIHQLNNDDQHINVDRIIQANLETFRVRKSQNVKAFVETNLNIDPQNLLCFFHRSYKECSSEYTQSTFDKFVGFHQIKDRKGLVANTYCAIFGDKTKILAINGAFHGGHRRLLFVQEFDVKKQKLKFKQIVTTNTDYISKEHIKNVIGDETNRELLLYRLHAREDNYNNCLNRDNDLERFTLDRVSDNELHDLFDVVYSIIYQDNSLTKEEIHEVEGEFYKNLELFCNNAKDLYEIQQRENNTPGWRYAFLADQLKKAGKHKMSIMKCYRKALDINPINRWFSKNYVDTLINIKDLPIEELENAKNHFENVTEQFSDSAVCWIGYGKILRICEKNHKGALEKFDRALYLIDWQSSRDKDLEYNCYKEKYGCLVALERYKEAERVALWLIELSKRKFKFAHKELESYHRIINLYDDLLKDYEAADRYRAILAQKSDALWAAIYRNRNLRIRGVSNTS